MTMDTKKENKTQSKNSLSQENNPSVRTYYVAGSTLLHNALINMGFSHISITGHGRSEVKAFIMNNLQIKSGYDEVELGVITSEKPFYIERYHGSSVSEKLLLSFTNNQDHDTISV